MDVNLERVMELKLKRVIEFKLEEMQLDGVTVLNLEVVKRPHLRRKEQS